VLIGTAVVGATTMIFSIIVLLTNGLTITSTNCRSSTRRSSSGSSWRRHDLLVHGASTQAVSTGAYRAVEFIKRNIKLDDSSEKASVEDSKKVVEICTEYAQKGMFNIS